MKNYRLERVFVVNEEDIETGASFKSNDLDDAMCQVMEWLMQEYGTILLGACDNWSLDRTYGSNVLDLYANGVWFTAFRLVNEGVVE